MDFLTYCAEDLHWFQLWFTQVMLIGLALTMRDVNTSTLPVQLCCGILLTRHFLEIVVLIIVYNKEEFELGLFSKAMLVVSFLLNLGLIKLYVDLEQ